MKDEKKRNLKKRMNYLKKVLIINKTSNPGKKKASNASSIGQEKYMKSSVNCEHLHTLS